VDVDRFRPNRSQGRNRRLNQGEIDLEIGRPELTREKIELYDRYHCYQASAKGWPDHGPKDAGDYQESFVLNPFPSEEWRYTLAGRLVGLGYVDRVPGGLSAVYYIYEPDLRERALGTWNVLSVIQRAADLGLPHVYLGYHVAGSPSLEYKAGFGPNETLGPDGVWRPFVS
jgi:arginine-tRNA-protein transferase